MGLFESGDSTGQVSLAGLLDGIAPRATDPGLVAADLARLISIGGWPALRQSETPEALNAVRSYLDEIRRVDVGRVDRTQRDPERVARLMRSLARNVATDAAITTLAADTSGADRQLKRDTISDYLDVLTRLKIVEDQPAWEPHMRSKYVLRRTAKRHFVDPSLAVAALRGSPETILADLNFLGFLFESLVIRDLRIYAQPRDGDVRHYRDNDGLEVDAIVQTVAGPWAGFEVKLGQDRVDAAAANLLKFARRVDTSRMGEPAVLAVITATGYAYVRKDGIAVIPIGTLGP
jgi:hypothetical protein